MPVILKVTVHLRPSITVIEYIYKDIPGTHNPRQTKVRGKDTSLPEK